jgi:hypothetical protein
MSRSRLLWIVPWFAVVVSVVPAAELRFVSPPPGYDVGTVDLGAGNSAGALAVDRACERHVYAAGFFDGGEKIVRLDLETSTRTVILDCPASVSVAGFAVLTSATLFVSDNIHGRLLILRDHNPRDGDFNDPSEVNDLIAPILVHPTFGWTGSSVQIVRSTPNRLGLPAGTVLFQSEDGGTTLGEVLAVVDPLTTPTYRPAGGAFFAGLDYGGGMVVDSMGRLAVASSSYPQLGTIWVCDDRSGNGAIEPSEGLALNLDGVTSGSKGLSALALDRSGRAYVCTTLPSVGPARSALLAFYLPDDPSSATRTAVTQLGLLDSSYVSAVVLTSSRPFWPGARDGATMVIAGYAGFWEPSDRLVTVRPAPSTGVGTWNLYD